VASGVGVGLELAVAAGMQCLGHTTPTLRLTLRTDRFRR
jgi:hypothetical protein